MAPIQIDEVDAAVVVSVMRLYARQSRSIDSGDASGWAETFSPDGVFVSPSYPQPVIGTAGLVAFAQRYADQARATGIVTRHVVTGVDVLPGGDGNGLRVHAYLQIVETPQNEASRLARLTTIEDRLAPDPSAPFGWRLAHRLVRRDDAGPGAVFSDNPAH